MQGDLEGGTETLLLVEDEAQVRRLAREVLARHGYRVLEAESGERALELAATHAAEIALVVSDVVLTGMTGLEVADALPGLGVHVPVLFVSGYSDHVAARRAAERPGATFLEKPYTPGVLLATIRRLLDAR